VLIDLHVSSGGKMVCDQPNALLSIQAHRPAKDPLPTSPVGMANMPPMAAQMNNMARWRQG
jgi:hypothetical protein